MSDYFLWLGVVVVGALVGGIGIGYYVRQLVTRHRKSTLEAKLRTLIDAARSEAKEIVLGAKEIAAKTAEEAKQDERERTKQIRRTEERLGEREASMDKRMQDMERREHELEERIERVKEAKVEVELMSEQTGKELERVSGLSREDAVREMTAHLEKTHADDLMLRVKKLESSGMEELERRAKNILAALIQRLATSTTSEVTTTTVSIPSDDLKGKIIGREGRNIKALERAVGVEIVVDDTPGSIVISAFDPVRRQIAKMALELLIKDGRIQPARIEEAAESARESIEKQIKEAGEQTAYEVGIFDLDPRLLSLIGRLKFRTSYGQNVLQHSVEMVHLSAMLASELGADVAIAKKGALLHDIGKAVDHEVQGTHVEIGRRILQKFGV
ncbi:MAG: Rnase Y domain-containing protein, partial [bacterium]|nr:Rnase Y domain-containing protein [bacterium]